MKGHALGLMGLALVVVSEKRLIAIYGVDDIVVEGR